ncbi:helix-turn-helix domain-containing protein [Propionibacteriaceae bacterium Y2011]
MRGLTVLRHLVSSPEPVSATRIAEISGMHQSSASRILGILASEGYIRRTNSQWYEPDFGVLSLSTAAVKRFDLATKPYDAMRTAARAHPGFSFSLGVLFKGEVLYFLRFTHGHEPETFSAPAFPLHLSAPGLRLLHLQPRPDALATLRLSQEVRGWEQPTTAVPDSPEELLDVTAGRMVDDCLVLNMWSSPNSVSAAIPVAAPGEVPTALAVAGPAGLVDAATLASWLHTHVDAVAESLRS